MSYEVFKMQNATLTEFIKELDKFGIGYTKVSMIVKDIIFDVHTDIEGRNRIAALYGIESEEMEFTGTYRVYVNKIKPVDFKPRHTNDCCCDICSPPKVTAGHFESYGNAYLIESLECDGDTWFAQYIVRTEGRDIHGQVMLRTWNQWVEHNQKRE